MPSKKLQIIALTALSLTAITSIAFGMGGQKIPEFRTIVREQPLYNRIPEKFKNRSLIYYRSLLQQADDFSCGIRTMFQIYSLESAAQKEALEDRSLESTLSNLLQNKKMLSKIRRRVQQCIEPGYDLTQGVYDYHLYDAAYTKLQHLKDKFLVLYLTDGTNQINTHDLTQHEQETFYEMCVEENQIPISKSQTFKNLIGQLDKPSDTAHFACLTSHHWFLATIKLNKQGKAQLLVFNTTNYDLDADGNIYFMIDQLLDEVATINETKNKRLARHNQY